MTDATDRQGLRWALIVAVALAAIVVPFLIWGPAIEAWISGWSTGVRADGRRTAQTLAVVVGLLAADPVLPIPSSILAVAAGMALGTVLGALAVALGLTLGVAVGWAIGRAAGRGGLPRVVGAHGVMRLQRLGDRFGVAVLVGTRAVPVLAELATIGAGAAGLSLRRTLLPCALANVVIATGYAVAGDLAVRAGWPQLAIVAALGVPAVAMLVALRRRPRAAEAGYHAGRQRS